MCPATVSNLGRIQMVLQHRPHQSGLSPHVLFCVDVGAVVA